MRKRSERTLAIRAAIMAPGVPNLSEIAREFGVSRQRVKQVAATVEAELGITLARYVTPRQPKPAKIDVRRQRTWATVPPERQEANRARRQRLLEAFAEDRRVVEAGRAAGIPDGSVPYEVGVLVTAGLLRCTYHNARNRTCRAIVPTSTPVPVLSGLPRAA